MTVHITHCRNIVAEYIHLTHKKNLLKWQYKSSTEKLGKGSNLQATISLLPYALTTWLHSVFPVGASVIHCTRWGPLTINCISVFLLSLVFALPHSTSLTQTIFQAQSLFFLRLCLRLSETETLKDCVSVFYPSLDPSPVSLCLLLLPAPIFTGLLCKSVPPGAAESWFHVVTALVQQILHSLGHQTCPGQTDSWRNIASTIQVIANCRFWRIDLGQVHEEAKGTFPTQQLPKYSISSPICTACWIQNI